MFAKFIKIMANLSMVAVVCNVVWVVYLIFTVGNSNAGIVPLFISYVFFIIFVLWRGIIGGKEDCQCLCTDWRWMFKKMVGMEQNKKGSE